MKKLKLLVASPIFVLFFLVQSFADISDVPVIGEFYNTSLVIKEEVASTINLTHRAVVDVAAFTIGGLALDAYVLTLPLEPAVMVRVIERISNPFYAIRLGHFLYMFKDQYGDVEGVTTFKNHITKVYKIGESAGLKHSLFQWDGTEETNKNSSVEKVKENELELNREVIATFVTIYDALYGKESLIQKDAIPDRYNYIEGNATDLEIINTVQPLIMRLLEKLIASLEPGDIKDAVQVIINDNLSSRKNVENNKAQAVTITLVDFVRHRVLKGYRQFVLEKERSTAFENWIVAKFEKDAGGLVQFLVGQNNKRYGVQITVDGLQGAFVKSLAKSRTNNFIQHVYNNHRNKEIFRPANKRVGAPEHTLQLDYLTALVNENRSSDKRYLPFFKELYRRYEKSISTGGISTTPTISVRNLPLIWTGAAVSGKGGTGIPNFHFVDREKDRAYYFYGNDALQLDLLIEENGVQTMFDRLNHLKTISCNAQYDWKAHVSYDGMLNLGFGEKLRDFGEQRCLKELRKRASVELELKEDRARLIEEIEKYQATSSFWFYKKYIQRTHIKQLIEQLAVKGEKGMPDYLLIYNPWLDHFSHFTGPFSDEIISPTGELNRLDYWLDRITQAYKDAGIYDQTLWGMAGDHGLSPVFYFLNPEVEVLKNLQSDLGKKMIVKKISSDEGEGPKLTHNLNFPSNRGVDVIVASTAGGNFMMDFFKDQEANWKEQPIYTDLIRWRGLHFKDDDQPVDMIDEITTRLMGTLDYLVVRESTCTDKKSHVRLVSHRNQIRYDEEVIREKDRLFYGSVKTGKPGILLDLQKTNPYVDPLSQTQKDKKKKLYTKCIVDARKNSMATWCTEDEWRALTSFTPRPDSVVQLSHLYDEDRAGTVNLFPSEGIGYNTIVPGRHAGEHFHEKDAFIGFWGAPVAPRTQLESTVNGSLAPTIYEYITGEKVIAGENGWGFPSVLDHLNIND